MGGYWLGFAGDRLGVLGQCYIVSGGCLGVLDCCYNVWGGC